MKKKFGAVLSDIDGTLVRGSLVLQHAATLHRAGIIDLGTHVETWENNVKDETSIKTLAEAYRAAIVGMRRKDLNIPQFLDEFLGDDSNFYTTLGRVKELKSKNWDVHLVSGSPSYLVLSFARRFGFTAKGTTYHVDRYGKLTGKLKPMFSADAKRKHVESLNLKRYEKIFAFGDTLSDQPMFSVANHRVLVDPNEDTLNSVEADEIVYA